MGAHALVGDAAAFLEAREELGDRLFGERAAVIGEDEMFGIRLWLATPMVEIRGQVVVAALAQQQLALLSPFAHDVDGPTLAVQVFEAHAAQLSLPHAGVQQGPQDGAVTRSEHAAHI